MGALAGAALLFLGCGPPPAPKTAETMATRYFGEAQGVDFVSEALTEAGVAFARGPSLDIRADDPLEVDVILEGIRYGIEWVSPEDRAAYGGALPEPDPAGQLRILAGTDDEDQEVQILLLDYRTYRYDPNRDRVERGATGPREAQGKLRRDILDFLEYVRGQGAL